MGNSNQSLNKELKLFGRVSAAVSHDLKNVLAIINEDAGLLEDLALLASKGHELDPQKIVTVANKIQNQIKRGDTIVKNMNLFAHLIDEDISQINVYEKLILLKALYTRQAAARCVEVEIVDAPPIFISGNAFDTAKILATILEKLFEISEKKSIIKIKFQDSGEVVSIFFECLGCHLDQDAESELKELASGSVKVQVQDTLVAVLFVKP